MRNEQKLVEMLRTAREATCIRIASERTGYVDTEVVDETAAWSELFYHLTGRLPTTAELNTITTQE